MTRVVAKALLLFLLVVGCGLQAGPLPTDPQALKTRADGLFAHGQYKEAAVDYERLVRASLNDSELAAYARFQQGLSRLKDKRGAAAFSVWAQLRLFHPKSGYVPATLLLEADTPGNASRSEALRDEILAKYPDSQEAATVLIQRGQAACDGRDYKTAAKWWTQYLEAFPRDASAVNIRAKLETVELVLHGHTDSAKALEISALAQTADALFDRAAFAAAAPFYAKIAQHGGATEGYSHAVTRLSQCQLALGDQRAAFDTLQRATDQLPGHAASLLVELVSQTAMNRGGDALRLRATQLILDRYPNSFEAQQALYIAGFVEMTRRNTPKAREWWNQLLTRFPDTGFRAAVEKQLPSNAVAKVERKEPARSQEAAKQAQKTPSDEQARREQRMRWQSEAREFAQVYANPRASSGQRAEATFQMAQRSFYLQQYATAAQQFQRVWGEFPNSARAEQAAFELAQMWFAAGEEQKGTGQLRFVIERFPASRWRPVALYCLGNRKTLQDADVQAGWACYEQLMTEYPAHPLTGKTRTFWALLNQYPPKHLAPQLLNLKAKS